MMIRKIGHRVAVTAVAVALAAGGTIAFAGPAFADDHDCDSCSHGGHGGRNIDYYKSNGGDGGNGGNSNANCAAPLGVSAGLMGQGGPVSQCNSNSGSGGDAGDGSD